MKKICCIVLALPLLLAGCVGGDAGVTDPKVTAELYKLIEDLNREGVTIMMVSHDISTALRNATHILHIGSEMFFGTRQEYLSSRIGRMFLEQEGGEH